MPRPRERRRAPRVEAQLNLVIAAPVQEVEASTRNLSSSGVYCNVVHEIPVMTRVALTITLPADTDAGGGGYRVACQGVIVRSEAAPGNGAEEPRQYRVAIFFTHITLRDRQRIARFVAGQLSAQRTSAAHHASAGAPPPPIARCLFGLCAVAAVFLGCATPFTVSRGGDTRTLINELGRTAQAPHTYTFHWLRRQLADVASHQRFDGLVVDLHGRAIRPIRQQDGDHVIELLTADRGGRAATQLTITPKELPTFQAVVRRYHFEPQLIMNAMGKPQVIVYAPVPASVSVIHVPACEALCVEVRRTTGGATHPLLGASRGDMGESEF